MTRHAALCAVALAVSSVHVRPASARDREEPIPPRSRRIILRLPDHAKKALRSGDAKAVVRFLDDMPLLLNARDEVDSTPLHIAAEHVEVVKLLLDRGADTTARCCCGRTPLQLAAYEGRNDTVDLLVARGGKLDLVSAICAGRAKDVAAILKKRPALASATRLDGWPGEGTALQIACFMGKAEAAKSLIEGGADVDQAARCGMLGRVPPVVVAVLGGKRLDVICVLLEAGANPNVMVPPSGCGTFRRRPARPSPLLRAARDRRDTRAVRLLRKYGARENFEAPPAPKPCESDAKAAADEKAEALAPAR